MAVAASLWPSSKPRRRRARWILVLRLLVGIAFLAFWEFSSGRLIDKLFISSASAVFGRLSKWVMDGTLVNHLSITLYATMWGFLIGSFVGFALGLLFGRFRALAEVLDPYITALYSIPKIALAPLFIIWFGIGIESKVAVSASIVFLWCFSTPMPGCAMSTHCSSTPSESWVAISGMCCAR